MAYALVLVHDEVPGRGERGIGTVGPALAAAGLDAVVTSFGFGGPPLPDPTEVAVVIVLGSVESAYDETVPWLGAELAYLRRTIDAGTPVLGICFGGQVLSRVLGGTVARAAAPEHGFVPLESTRPDLVPAGEWFAHHSDTFTLPPGATLIAGNEVGVQAFSHGRHLGVQFHPEITPAVFDTWLEHWGTGDGWADSATLAGAIRARAEPSAQACKHLVGAFLARALGGAEVPGGRSLH